MISQDNKIKRYCSESLKLVENYDKAVADTEHQWDCHHRGEVLPCGVFSVQDLEKFGLYWHRPASELVFLRYDEHRSLHSKNRTKETLSKIEDSKKGDKNPNYGKRLSKETRRKMSEARRRYWQNKKSFD